MRAAQYILILLSFFLPVFGGHCTGTGPVVHHATDSLPADFETLTVRDGLSQGLVLSLIQDREGYMWFSSKEGLNRYDGYHFKIYRHDPTDPYSLPDNYVRTIAEDSSGLLWINTDTKGVCLFDKKTERFYPVTFLNRDSIRDSSNYECIILRYGILFLRSYDHTLLYHIGHIGTISANGPVFGPERILLDDRTIPGLRKYDIWSRKYNTWLSDSSIIYLWNDSLYALRPDREMKTWAARAVSILPYQAIDSVSFQVFDVPSAPYFFVSSGHHNILCLKKTMQPLHDFVTDGISWHEGQITPDAAGNALLSREEGYYYIDFSGAKMYRLQGANTKHNALGQCDRNGQLWLGTFGFGVSSFGTHRWRFHTYAYQGWHANGNQSWLLDCRIFDKSVMVDLRTMNPHPMPVNPEVLFYHKIEDLGRDRGGKLWGINPTFINSEWKVSSLDTGSQVWVQHPSITLVDNETGIAFFDKANDMWIYHCEGAKKYALIHYATATSRIEGKYMFPVTGDVNESDMVSSHWLDAQGLLWLGTPVGLISFDERKKEWHVWQNKKGDSTSLSNDKVFSVCPDPRQPSRYLWVGTNGSGFCRFEIATGRFKRYSDKDGLPNNVVYGILTDTMDHLWLSTNRGLSCFDPQAAEKGLPAFRNFTEDDGLAGDEFNHGQYQKLPDGRLMFGGVNGTTIFDPAEVIQQNPAPNIVLTGLSIFNKPVNWRADTNIINTPIGYARRITLNHVQNMFAIEFAALDYAHADRKLYKYKLEGFNTDWVDNGNRNSAIFTNLDPGRYVFRVIGCNHDGAWNTTGASVEIIILPPWWATWWFRMLMAVLVISFLYGLYQYRLRQLLRVERVRNDIARDLHDEIGSTISSMSLYSAVMKRSSDQLSEQTLKILDKIIEGTSQMMESMNDMVWSIKAENDNFEQVLNRMRAFAVNVTEATGVKLHFAAEREAEKLHVGMERRKNIYLIYKEAVNNAIKYARATDLWVNVTSEGNVLQLAVRDNGIGFDMGVPGTKPTLSGNGLKSMKQRAEEIKAELLISSKPGQGTEIKLKLKL